MEILDPQAKSIVTFNGTPPESGGREGRGAAPAAAPEPDEEGGGRGGPPATVTVKQGMNRFNWDMRYPNARDFPGLIMWAGSVRGPLAPPGKYQVRLTAAGVTKTQDFVIKRNAAVPTVTDADLHEQFELAKAINDKVTVANEAVIRIRNLKSQIADRTGKASDQSLKAVAQTLTDKLTDVEGEIYQYRNRSSQDPLNYPIRLNNKLAALQGIVESGDNRADRSVLHRVQGPVVAARPAGSEARCTRPHRTVGAEQDSCLSEAGTGGGWGEIKSYQLSAVSES